MDSLRSVEVERHGGVTLIRLAEPATLNAMSVGMIAELDAALVAAERESRAVVLTGKGRAFCSGANLVGTVDPAAVTYDAGSLLETHFNPLMLRIRSCKVPIVTAVNGAAAGIGASIALAADLIVMAQSGYFLQAFVRIGLVPDGGSAFLLMHAVGRARAMEMMLLGERIGAAKASEWGLVNRVVADAELLDEAMKVGQSLASGPTTTLGLIRQLGWNATQRDFGEMLALERELQREAGRTGDHREGIDAFLNKRKPDFKGV